MNFYADQWILNAHVCVSVEGIARDNPINTIFLMCIISVYIINLIL